LPELPHYVALGEVSQDAGKKAPALAVPPFSDRDIDRDVGSVLAPAFDLSDAASSREAFEITIMAFADIRKHQDADRAPDNIFRTVAKDIECRAIS
jgi:hypothetical protein